MGGIADSAQIGPVLAAVLDAQQATQAMLASAELAEMADRVVAYAGTRGCDVLVAATSSVERLVGAALMRGAGYVRALTPDEQIDGLKILIVDAVVAGPAQLATTRDRLLAAGAGHVDAVACGSRGPASSQITVLV